MNFEPVRERFGIYFDQLDLSKTYGRIVEMMKHADSVLFMRHFAWSKWIFCFLSIFLGGFTIAAKENFLLIDGTTNEIIAEFGPNITDRFSPCSSFKITLSLMGYDSGILKDDKHPVWDFQEGSFWQSNA